MVGKKTIFDLIRFDSIVCDSNSHHNDSTHSHTQLMPMGEIQKDWEHDRTRNAERLKISNMNTRTVFLIVRAYLKPGELAGLAEDIREDVCCGNKEKSASCCDRWMRGEYECG